MDLKEEQVLGDDIERHWYYRAKARLLAASISRVGTVLDVGAGSGFFSRWLLRHGLAEKAICIDPYYENERDEEEAGRPLLFRRSIEVCQADLILMMDVLEHVEDDAGLLRRYLAHLRGDGRCFITLPAFSFLWSSHDVFLDHKRRYTLPQAERLARSAGFRDVRGHYYYGAVFPFAAGARLMRRGRTAQASDLQMHSPPVNAVLSGLCQAEESFMRWNRIAGLSVALTCSGKLPESLLAA